MQDKPISLIWGVGPSYRRRIKLNIQMAIDSGYDNIMDYIVLTDVPEDFYEMQDKTKKIIHIVDIHKERENYPWSIEQEYIPTNQETYGDDFRDGLLRQRKIFSHCLDRFSIKSACDLGYYKLCMHDPDAVFYYRWITEGKIKEEFFWEKFNTNPNSVKASVYEKLEIKEDHPFIYSRAIGGNSALTLQYLVYLIKHLNDKFNTRFPMLHSKLDVSESQVKYFHFESPEFGKKYFEVLNELAKVCYSKDGENPLFMHGCTGIMWGDFIPYATAHLYTGLQVLNFPNYEIYGGYVFGDDRFFLPPGFSFQLGKNQDEFFEVNKDKIEQMKLNNQWPVLNPDNYIIDYLLKK